MSAETAIADAVRDACDVTSSTPYRPASLTHHSAFVAPADVWKQTEDGGFCDVSVGLDVYLIAGAADVVNSFEWLDAQSTILMNLAPIDVGGDEIAATETLAPFVFNDGTGASYLTVRVTYSRFRT